MEKLLKEKQYFNQKRHKMIEAYGSDVYAVVKGEKFFCLAKSKQVALDYVNNEIESKHAFVGKLSEEAK